jgi:hypothetical protein
MGKGAPLRRLFFCNPVWVDEDIQEIVEHTRRVMGLQWRPVVFGRRTFNRKECVVMLQRKRGLSESTSLLRAAKRVSRAVPHRLKSVRDDKLLAR